LDIVNFDTEFIQLIQAGKYREAEQLLTQKYEELKRRDPNNDLRYIVNKLAQLYCLPFAENLDKAKGYYAELERTFPGRETDADLAMFYFYTLRDFDKTIQKVRQMGSLEEQRKTDIPSYYTSLTLLGQALLNLGRSHEAEKVLLDLTKLVDLFPRQVPCGDEMNFLEEMTKRQVAPVLCKHLLGFVIPRLRDPEYQSRASLVLRQLEE
jgi:tetratricopeptide (TPR) repeat protein